MTVKKLHVPSLHLVAAGRELNQPARGGGVTTADVRIMRAHENAHTAAALGSQLQPPRLDLIEMLNQRDGCANTRAAHAFGQRPELVHPIHAAQ